MNQDVTTLISNLETRTRQLMLQYDKLQQKQETTERKLVELQQYVQALEDENHELEEKYATLKMARLVDMADDDDLKTTRKRINKMIASVDKCLATLKAQ